jgi:hypothetical protein
MASITAAASAAFLGVSVPRAAPTKVSRQHSAPLSHQLCVRPFFFLAIFLVSFGIFPPLLTFRRLSADAVPPYVISSLAGSPRGRGRSSCCRPCQGANPPIPASFFSQNAGAAEQSATVNSLFWQSFWQKRPPHAHASSGDNRRLTNMPAHPFLLSPF